MRFQDIQKMAKNMNININKMKKTDMIRAIQKAESNIACYGTERIEHCHEEACSWRKDCLALNSHLRHQ